MSSHSEAALVRRTHLPLLSILCSLLLDAGWGHAAPAVPFAPLEDAVVGRAVVHALLSGAASVGLQFLLRYTYAYVRRIWGQYRPAVARWYRRR